MAAPGDFSGELRPMGRPPFHVSAVQRVCAAIVTYNPDGDLAPRLARLIEEIPHCLIIDNSDSPKGRRLSARAAATLGCEHRVNGSNRGIATAINQTLRWGQGQGMHWILLLDQDTQITGCGLLEPYGSVIAAAGAGSDLAGIGLATRRGQSGNGMEAAETDDIVTSGSLLRIDTLSGAGGAWEALFIDGVDRELCIRLRQQGLRLLAFRHPGLRHRIGAGRRVRLLGRTLYVTDHPPIRRYYSARNRILIAKRHGCAVGWYTFFRDDVVAPLFERHRSAKLRASLLGLWHGLRGWSGPAPADLLSHPEAGPA